MQIPNNTLKFQHIIDNSQRNPENQKALHQIITRSIMQNIYTLSDFRCNQKTAGARALPHAGRTPGRGTGGKRGIHIFFKSA
jgi:hypothetical protein